MDNIFGTIKCKKCGEICLYDIFMGYYKCQNPKCGKKWVIYDENSI